MKTRLNLLKSVVGGFALLLLLPNASPAWGGGAQCEDVGTPGHRRLNVVTINLAFFEGKRRDERLRRIADFAAAKQVDIMFLQEVVSISDAFSMALFETPGTPNSANDLKNILSTEHGLDYNLKTVFETGIPGALTSSNAILSRCEIRATLSWFLPITEQIQIEGSTLSPIALPITRNVMMLRVKIPNAPERRFRKINVYNTHLCAGGSGSFEGGGIRVSVEGCNVGGRETQLVSALNFVEISERLFSFFSSKPHIFGGDFNIDNFRDPDGDGLFGIEKPLYDRITGAGFTDAYAKFQESRGRPLEDLCEDDTSDPSPFQDWAPDEHCTKGVVDFLEFPEFSDATPRRIDYIFEKRFGVRRSEVIFNPLVDSSEVMTTVSDHSGVLVRLRLR